MASHGATGELEGFEIFIKYLPAITTEDGLSELFAEAGEIVGVPRLLKHGDGSCKGCGWITFSSDASMRKAIAMNGVSFHKRHLEFDEAGRGFRLEADGPLDLRFDQSKGETAWEFMQSATRSELIRVISEYGETSDAMAARRIVDAICVAREQGVLPKRTKEFAALVARAKGVEYQAMHPAKLAFQALRIHLNDEFGEFRRGLKAAFGLLADGGRIGVITWKHSECNLLIDFFREYEAARDEAPQLAWYMAQEGSTPLSAEWSLHMQATLRPSVDELRENTRARSAVLHIMTKRRQPRMAQLERRLYPLLGWDTSDTRDTSDTSAPTASRSGGGVRLEGGTSATAKPGKTKKLKKKKRQPTQHEPDAGVAQKRKVIKKKKGVAPDLEKKKKKPKTS